LENANSLPSEKQLERIATGFNLNQEDIDTLYRAARHDPPKIHNLPFDRNLLFTGRDTYFEDLDKHFKAGNSVALTQPLSINGLGGIGKTQLALEYAYRCFPNVYQAVFWVNAADEETLLASYYKLAQILELPERDEQNLYKVVEAVNQCLERHRNWLLIMDNADNLQLVRSFFPEAHEGRILLTTRSQIVGNIATPILIEQMPLSEGRLFLLRRSGVLRGKAKLDDVSADTLASVTQLVELLDGHPLALDQAGAYIEEGASFTEYINLYQEKRSDLLRRRGLLDSEYPASVAATFELCFAKAHEYHPLATDILRFCAFLHPDDIPDELFQHDDSFKSDTTALIDGRTALLRFSLIKRNTQERIFSMHRLVQAVLIDAMSTDVQKQWADRVARVLSAAFPEDHIRDWRQCARLLPHAMYCATWTEDDLLLTAGVTTLSYITGVYLRTRGIYYSVAEVLFRQVLSSLEQQVGVEHPATAAVLSDLSYLIYLQGKDVHTEPWLTEPMLSYPLAILINQLGVEHPITINSMQNLAAIYAKQGKYKQAEELLFEALSNLEQQRGAEDPETAMTLYRLASLYHEQGSYEQAESFYRLSLSILEAHLEAGDVKIAIPLYGLASLLDHQGQYDQAEALYQWFLHIHERQLGAAHALTQAARRLYADFLRSMKRDAEAAALEANDEPPV
jgi:tetratricopeptide (TPR) repeat protein